MSFYGFSSMENSFLMLFLHYDVPEYPNPRWPPDAILKISFFTLYHGLKCLNRAFQYGEFISYVFVFNFQVPNPR